jgi:hypothetical protein
MAEPPLVDGVGCECSAVTLEPTWSDRQSERRIKTQESDESGAGVRRQAGPKHFVRSLANRPQAFRSFAGNEKVNQGDKHMKATIENGELIIRLPLNKTPVLSSSGKPLVVASTHGNQKTEAAVNSQPVIIGVNAYIARPTR